MYYTSTTRAGAKDPKLLCVEKGCPIDQTFLEFFESNIFIQKNLLKIVLNEHVNDDLLGVSQVN